VQEKEHLQDCLDYVAARASRHSVADWTDGNFIELSEDIQKETGILIHRNTLKRLFGKVQAGEESRPQKDTRNALALYAGFEDWGQFIDQNTLRRSELPKTEEQQPTSPTMDSEPGSDPSSSSYEADRTSNWMVGIVMLLIMVGTFYYWKTKARNQKPVPSVTQTEISTSGSNSFFEEIC
jgi:hypothetical protein